MLLKARRISKPRKASAPEVEMTPEDKKRIRGFVNTTKSPSSAMLNVSETQELGKALEAAVGKYNLTEVAARPNAGSDGNLRKSGSRTRGNERRRRDRISV